MLTGSSGSDDAPAPVDYGNPSSLHNRGMEAENYVKEARKRIAQTLKVNEKEIYFTSGERGNNLAIVGSALANKRSGMHVITTAIEHPSVANPFAYLEEQDLPLLICRWMLMAVFPYRI